MHSEMKSYIQSLFFQSNFFMINSRTAKLVVFAIKNDAVFLVDGMEAFSGYLFCKKTKCIKTLVLPFRLEAKAIKLVTYGTFTLNSFAALIFVRSNAFSLFIASIQFNFTAKLI